MRSQTGSRGGGGEIGSSRPEKVAYIVSRFPKLTETFVLYELVELEALGTQVELYPLIREKQRITHPEADRWTERARFRPFLSLAMVRAQLHFLRSKPAAYLGTLLHVLRRTWGSSNYFVGAPAVFLKAVSFAHDMRREGVTHVHAHFANHPTLAAYIVRRLTGIPYSFTAHAHDLFVEQRMLDSKVEEAAFAVTISEYNKRFMIDMCGDGSREKIRVIHCGVDPTLFAPRSPARADGPIRLLCVAALEEKKGHRYLVEACALLRDRGVDFVCDLVGEGPLRGEIESRVAGLGLGEHIRVLGGKPRPEVIRMLAEADVAVLASLVTKGGKREGIPVVLMEAMASAVPVVATAISGIPELVEDGSTGLLVPPREVEPLADALQHLASDEETRRRVGLAGREKVLREFDLRANTALLRQSFLDSARPQSDERGPLTDRALLASSAGS
jgi:colanic acid/amylovoran biosynthesis glycosyltransferase